MARINDTFAASLPLADDLRAADGGADGGAAGRTDRRRGPAAVAPPTRRRAAGRSRWPSPRSRSGSSNELAPGNLAYNFQSLIRFTGALDTAALERTLRRSSAATKSSAPRSSWRASAGADDRAADADRAAGDRPASSARGRAPPNRGAVVRRAVPDAIRSQRPPLVRWTLLRVGRRRHVLIHVEHHLVHDGWSFSVLLRELKTLYQAFSRGEPSPLADPAWQFADYAAWQRQTLQGDVLRRELDFWRAPLAGAPAALDLPTDHPRPDDAQLPRRRRTVRGADRSLRRAARLQPPREGHAVHDDGGGVQGAAVAVHRPGGHGHRIGDGEPDAPRARAGPRHVREPGRACAPICPATRRFASSCTGVRKVALDAYAHQDTPFGKLVETLQPKRDPSRNPIFQVLFSFHDAAVPDLSFDGLTGTIVERHNGSAKFDLNVICIPRVEQRVGDGPVSERARADDDVGVQRRSVRARDRGADVRRVPEPASRGRSAHPDGRLSELPLLAPADRRSARDRVERDGRRTRSRSAPFALRSAGAADARRRRGHLRGPAADLLAS